MVFIGAVLLVFALGWSRAFSGMLISPATVYFSALFLHTCIDPLIRQLSVRFGPELTDYASFYNLSCYAAAVAGFSLVLMFRRKSSEVANLKLTFALSPQAFKILTLITSSLLVLAILLLLQSGAIGAARGLHGGGLDAAKPLAFRIARTILTYATFLAIFLPISASLSPQLQRRGYIVASLVPLILIVLIDVSTFGRNATMTAAVGLFIAGSSRVRKLSLKDVTLTILVLLLISFFGLMRRLRIGITDLSFEALADATGAGRLGLQQMFEFVLTTLSGQEVFYLVLRGFHKDELFYGSTYLHSFLSRIGLRPLLPDDYRQPAGWFRDEFLSLASYGRDFSMIAESYINFGSYGFVVFFVVGALIGWMNILALRSGNLLVICWASYMVVNMIVGLRNDSVPVMTRAIYSPLIVIGFLYAYRLLCLLAPKSRSQTPAE